MQVADQFRACSIMGAGLTLRCPMDRQILFPFFVEDRRGEYFFSLDNKEWAGPFATIEAVVDAAKPQIVATIEYWFNTPPTH